MSCVKWTPVLVLGYESSHVHRGRVSIRDFCDKGSVYTLRDIVRLLCIFFSFFYIYLMYTGLVTIWHTLYLSLDIYVDVCYSPIFTWIVSFLSLCTCFLFSVCNLLFLFHTTMPWWVLFKVFQKYRLSKSSCKVFQKFVLRLILLYSTSEYELSVLWLLSYVHLFVVILSWIAKGGDY